MQPAYRIQPLIVILFCVQLAGLARAVTAEDYLREGNGAFKDQRFDQAIYAYTKVIDSNPHLAKAYDNRGAAYAQEGSLTRAIDDFTMAIANDPKDGQAYCNRGHAYDQKGDLLQSIADYTRAIEINPLNTKAYNSRSFVYYEAKQYDKSWADVFKLESLGGRVDSDFYRQLKKVSGQER
ncbi:MAG: tetratricopeptide repeat protein [Candidatus Omnitrophica bacterium]|nr:tetratricopeptide repeat protein [Candidatus Omnitrophota bacterium]